MKEAEEIDIWEFEPFCFINGQPRLHETEDAIFEYLAGSGHYPLVIDDLFANPKKIQAIKLFNPKTVILGTTGAYRDKIDLVLNEFKKLDWKPVNAIFTMGEGYFGDLIRSGVNGFKVYPYYKSMKGLPVIRPLEDYEY